MSGASLEECHTTSVRILNEEPSVGLTAPVYSRTANKGRTIPSDWMFSSRCQWRLQWRDCWTKHSSLKHYEKLPFRPKLLISIVLCVRQRLMHFSFLEIFLPMSYHLRDHTHGRCAQTEQTGNNISSDNNITYIPPARVVRFTSSLLPIHITSRIDHL